MRTRLRVHQRLVGGRLHQPRQQPVRLVYHQMQVQRQTRGAADGVNNHRPERYVGHETPVHHINMQQVGPGDFRILNLLRQPPEIRRQHRRRNLNTRRNRDPCRRCRPRSVVPHHQ